MNSPSPSRNKESNRPQAAPRVDPAILDPLNPEQRRAVEAADGPVLILAGAGTGKTRVIAHRIAYLLASRPDLSPRNILALTFSRKASREMLERLQRLLGAAAQELGVFTFHGFCRRFLQEHALELGLPSRFLLLDRTESWIFFRRFLPEMKPSVYWDLSDPTDCIDGFLRFISRAKDELVSPAEFAAYAAEEADPQQRKASQEAGRIYRAFGRRMRERGVLDFGDLIVETFRALERRPALSARLQSICRYILVDEFQDTNVAQIHLLFKMAGAAGNLCVVGDDDQAIYRFRGASFASFVLMKQRYPQLKTLRLTRNYRSSRPILSAAGRLIRHNDPDRYDPQKLLWTEREGEVPVQVVVCRDEQDEAGRIVETIRRLVKGEPAGPGQYDQVAVLYRAHHHRDRLVEALRGAGIPFVVEAGTALFEEEPIKDLVAFLRVLNDPSDSISLFRLLSSRAWKIPPADLMVLTRSAKERNVALADGLKEISGLPVSSETRESVCRLLADLERGRLREGREGAGSLIRRLAGESFLRELFSAPHMAALGRFLRLADRAAELQPESDTLGSFLWYLDSYRAAGGDLPEEEGEAAGNQVRLMTVHQAKGLEFDWVILLGMVQGRFPTRGRPEPLPFPVVLMKEPLPQGDYHLQEERRLCYVACTRARRGLFLMTQERLYHRPSLFVREISEDAAPEELQWVPQESGGAVEAGRIPSPERGSVGPAGSTAFPLPSRFSYTQLETYRYCPLKYQYQYLYQIPVRPTPQLNFGIDLHSCLEDFSRRGIEGGAPSLEDLLGSFQSAFMPGRYGEPLEEERYRRLGAELLTAFYRQHQAAAVLPLFVEQPFCLPLGDVWFQGVIDRVDPLPAGGVEIVDYKTGRPKEKVDPPERLQLRMYALACKELFRLEPKRLSFYFLRSGGKLSFDQEPSDLETVKEEALGIIRTIRSGLFTPTPSPMKCRRCDFRSVCPASMA